MKLLRYIPSHQLYFFGLFFLAASLPLSKFTISLAQFILVGNWLLQKNYRQKFNQFKSNKIALLICSLYLLHLIGLIYTSDFDYALKDLRTKLPIFIFPFIVATSPVVSKKILDQILFVLAAAVLVSTLISFSLYLEIGGKVITDIRQISPLISHIRLALLVCVSFAILIYFSVAPSQLQFIENNKILWQILFGLIAFWFIFFLIILQSVTGLSVIFIGLFTFSIYLSVINKKPVVSFLILMISLSFSGFILRYVYDLAKPHLIVSVIDKRALPKTTINGNDYEYKFDESFTENGNNYGLFICEKELKNEWNKRSKILPYDSLDKKKQLVNFTLMRYLTSKGLPKDSLGMSQLSSSEIKEIENGIPNWKIKNMNSLEERIYEIVCEYQTYTKHYNSSGHSLSMRIEYWSTAIDIIKKNLILGVGTGDVKMAFEKQYELNRTNLAKEWRNRAHNQYLTILVTFGIPGLIWFLGWLFIPLFQLRNTLHPVYFAFFFIFTFTMLFEDTLETQAGLSFGIFFSCLFLLSESYKQNKFDKQD